MFVKATALFALLVGCQAGIVNVYPDAHAPSYINGYDSYQAPIYEHAYGHGHDVYEGDHYAYPKYKFAYGVQDPHTGDHKSQEEYRDGDVVKGHYTVADPDGTLRVVHYTADDINGFNAVVEKHGHSVHPEPIHHVAPVVVEKVIPIVEKVVYGNPHGYDGVGYGQGYDGVGYGQGYHGY